MSFTHCSSSVSFFIPPYFKGDCKEILQEASIKQSKANFSELRELVKWHCCTKDHGDIVFMSPLTDFAKNCLRQHVRAYCHRIFADPVADAYDASSNQPQYIGRNEGDADYRMKGYYIPVDEGGIEYYLNRRLEDAHPGLYGSTAMWKSKPDELKSPVRASHRSKFGTNVNVRSASGGASSSSKPGAAQLAGGN